jgi:hypothetical protein
MHFLFNLLRIMGLYMFLALLDHPEDALRKQRLVYGMRVVSVGCTRVGMELHGVELCQLASPGLVQPTDITRTQYSKCCLWSAF